jgi:hypothetical protein
VNSSKERRRVFGVSCGDAAPTFEMKKSILDQVAQFVKVFVIFALFFTVFLRWNYNFHTGCGCLGDDGIGVIPTVSQ